MRFGRRHAGRRSLPRALAALLMLASLVLPIAPRAAAAPSTVATPRVGGTAPAISAGETFACLLSGDGTLSCWGRLWSSDGSVRVLTPEPEPVALASAPDTRFRRIAVGRDHACAITVTGGLACWGNNGSGQLGLGSVGQVEPEPQSVDLTAVGPVIEIAAGGAHTCVLNARGEIWCWGRNYDGELGTGNFDDSPHPVRVTDPEGVPGQRYVAVTAYDFFTCAVASDRTAWCWGANAFGQLGRNASGFEYATPARVLASCEPSCVDERLVFAQVAAGYRHACGVTVTGEALCWGANYRSQLGDGTTADRQGAVPVETDGAAPDRYRSISAGAFHSCGIDEGGLTWCWGSEWQGALGSGGSAVGGDEFSAPSQNVPVAVTIAGAAPDRYLSVAAAFYYTCALSQEGDPVCWGYDGYGGLGNGEEVASVTTPARTRHGGPPRVFPGSATGLAHSCAVSARNKVWCWGANDDGDLGSGQPPVADQPELAPVPVALDDYVLDLSANGRTATVDGSTVRWSATCAVTFDGTPWCWGSNRSGMLGIGSNDPASLETPAPLTVVTNPPSAVLARRVVVGGSHACLIDGRGFARCWGADDRGQVGDGFPRSPAVLAPSAAVGYETLAFLTVAAGGLHTCGIAVTVPGGDFGEWCWGADDVGQRGDSGGIPGTDTNAPSPVDNPWSDFKALSAGGLHTCAIAADGLAYCWGSDAFGQLGNGGDHVDRSQPTQVVLPPDDADERFVDITAGDRHTCATTATGRVFCWGADDEGQIGDGDAGDDGEGDPDATQPTEVLVPPGRTALLVVTGTFHTCLLLDDGSLTCWGRNTDGQTGSGDRDPVFEPHGDPIELPNVLTLSAHGPEGAVGGDSPFDLSVDVENLSDAVVDDAVVAVVFDAPGIGVGDDPLQDCVITPAEPGTSAFRCALPPIDPVAPMETITAAFTFVAPRVDDQDLLVADLEVSTASPEDVTEDNRDSVEVQLDPNLLAIDAAGPGSAASGGPIAWDLEVRNGLGDGGSTLAYEVVVTFVGPTGDVPELPCGEASDDDEGGTRTRTYTCSQVMLGDPDGALAPGEARTVEALGTAPLVESGTRGFTATFEVRPIGGQEEVHTADDVSGPIATTVYAIIAGALLLEVDDPPPVVSGGYVAIPVRITNASDAARATVDLDVTLPSGFTMRTAGCSLLSAPSAYRCTVVRSTAPLASGGTRETTVFAQARSVTVREDEIPVDFTVGAGQIPSGSVTASVDVVPDPLAVLVIAAPDRVSEGAAITYGLNVINGSGAAVAGVRVIATFDDTSLDNPDPARCTASSVAGRISFDCLIGSVASPGVGLLLKVTAPTVDADTLLTAEFAVAATPDPGGFGANDVERAATLVRDLTDGIGGARMRLDYPTADPVDLATGGTLGAGDQSGLVVTLPQGFAGSIRLDEVRLTRGAGSPGSRIGTLARIRTLARREPAVTPCDPSAYVAACLPFDITIQPVVAAPFAYVFTLRYDASAFIDPSTGRAIRIRTVSLFHDPDGDDADYILYGACPRGTTLQTLTSDACIASRAVDRATGEYIFVVYTTVNGRWRPGR